MDDPKRAYSIYTVDGRFVFLNDNLAMAKDHSESLSFNSNFPKILSDPTYLGFAKDYATGFVDKEDK